MLVQATSLFTTVQDELKWLNNFETGTVGGKDLVEKRYQVGVLNDGMKLTYAFALNMGKYKGWQQVGHGGAGAAFDREEQYGPTGEQSCNQCQTQT